jgi:hypothetical protein
MQGFDSSWIEPLIDSLVATLWNLFFGDKGLFMMIYNWIPIIGSDPWSVETWFYVMTFGGIMLFLRFYGYGAIAEAVRRVK